MARPFAMLTAVKPVWNGKEFKIEVHRDVHALAAYAGQGFMVYDDPALAIQGIKDGRLVPSWTARKKEAVVVWLESEVLTTV